MKVITATTMDEYFSFHYDGEFSTPLLLLRREVAEIIFDKKDWETKRILQLGNVVIEKVGGSYVVYEQGLFIRPTMVWDQATKSRLSTIFEVTR